MSKKRAIGRKIANGVALNKEVPAFQSESIKRKMARIDALTKVAANVDKEYSFNDVQLAKQALRKIAAYSYATTESPNRHNKDSWRASGKLPSTGKQKIKRGPSSPRI